MPANEGTAPAYDLATFPDLDLVRGLDALREDRGRIVSRLTALDEEFRGLPMSDDGRAEFKDLKDRQTEVDTRIAELEAREEYMLRVASEDDGDPQPTRAVERAGQRMATRASAGTRVPDNIYELWSYRSYARNEDHYLELLKEGARRAIDKAHYPLPDVDEDAIRSDLNGLLERIDDPAALARRMLGTGSPEYGRAFGRVLQSNDDSAIRALSLGSDPAGGYAVPFQLDPTVLLTSDGVINPLRALSRVERITGKTWQGVNSAGITVTRSAEASEADDNSPTLSQPEVDTSRVQAFVPFSVELEVSWSALQAEVAMMLMDAKDTEEADSFINGDGTGVNPAGLIETMDAGSIVFTGDTSFGVEDVYAVKNALPPRWRPRAQWLAEGSIYDVVRQFDTAGGSNLWVQLQDGNPPNLIGYPASEQSEMDSTVADQSDILVIGDFSNFLIVDRIGMSIELIPHVFGANQRPTGQRGIYALWNNSAASLNDKAFRLLRVGSS